MEHEIAQLTQALRAQMEQQGKLFGIMGRMAKANSSPADAKKLENDMFAKPATRFSKSVEGMQSSMGQWNRAMGTMSTAADRTSNSVKLLGKDAGSAGDALSGMAKALLGGAIGGVLVGGLINYVTGLTTTYQGMAEIGQNFGGSIIGMSKAAAESTMTLDRFAQVMKSNSELAAQIAGKGSGLGKLLSSVRNTSMEFGMFGYTMESLDSLTLSYMESLRHQGRLEDYTQAQAVASVKSLAKETSAMALVYGKSRDEINKTTNVARNAPSYKARIAQMDGETAKRADDIMQHSLGILAGMPGDLGKLMTTTMSELFGANGQVGLVSTYQSLFAKMPNAADIMKDAYDGVEKAIASGDKDLADKAMVNFQNQMRDMAKSQMGNLQIWANSTDASLREAATQFIELGTSTKKITVDQLRDARKAAAKQDEITRVANNTAQAWAQISSSLKLSLMPLAEGPLQAFAKGITDFVASDAFTGPGGLKENLANLSNVFKTWAENITSPANMSVFSKWIGDLAPRLQSFVGAIKPEDFKKTLDKVTEVISGVGTAFGVLISVIGGVGQALGMVGSVFKGVGTLMDSLGIGFKELAIGVGLAYAGFKAMQLASFVRGLQRMDVRAQNVNINGKGLGGFGGGDGSGRRDRGGRGGGGGDDSPNKPKGGGRMRRWGGKAAAGLGTIAAIGGGYAADLLGGIAEFAESKLTESAEDTAKKAKAVKTSVPEVPGSAAKAAGDGLTKTAGQAEDAATRGLKGGAILKSLGIAGRALNLVTDGMQIYDLHERKKAENWDDEKFKEELIKLLSPMLAGGAGAMVGGAVGGGVGSLVGPVGSIIGGIGGAIGGGFGGDWVGEKLAPMIVEKLKINPVGEQFGPAVPATISSPNQIDPNATEQNLSQFQNRMAENARAETIRQDTLNENVLKLTEVTRQNGEMQAQLLNRNNETVKNTATNIVRATENNGN